MGGVVNRRRSEGYSHDRGDDATHCMILLRVTYVST